jgi:gliding motility-associated-like protein
LFLATANVSFAQQTSTCSNADFELGNFSNWSGTTGGCCPIISTATGIVNGRHTIMTGNGFDPFSNGNIPVVAPGGLFSARLGNSNIGAEAEQLSYSFSVGTNNTLFIYRYAVVFEDPNHDAASQPRFEIRVFDANGAPINCGTYNVFSSGGIPGFVTYNDNFGNTYHYKDWTTVGIDLSAYVGQNVTIEFSTGDCAYGGHFGYAYLDTYCSPLVISSDFCPGSFTTNINAPVGFVSYLWNTGETTQSIQVNNPTVGATYSCVMTSVAGCTITLSTVLQETIIASGIAQSSLCQNAVQFTDSSQVLVGSPINQWLWDFGDGSSSTLQNPTHSYATPGSYTVSLIATNSGGCADTTTTQVQVIPPPTVDFTIAPACPGETSQLIDQSASSNGGIIAWTWDFGDGTSGDTIQNPFHVYDLPGSYNASLIVTDSAGCSDTLVQSIQPLPGPLAGFTAISNCQDNLISFTDTTLASGTNVVDWIWDFGDSSPVVTGTGTPTHSYANPGAYNVTLIVTTANGCIDTIIQPISVLSSLLPDFQSDTLCSGNLASFQSLSSIANGVIQSYLWNFNDNTPVQNGMNVNHIFQNPGVYDVVHTIVASNGCRDSITRQIIILESPQAVVGFSEVCPGSITVFNSPSVQGDAPIATYGWNFGDGSPDTLGFSIFHTYYNAGTYLVTHYVVDQNGCYDTVTQSVSTSPIPVANFVAPLNCAGLPSVFTNAASVSTGVIVSSQWYFGDLTPATNDTNPVHTYASPGAYFVSLVVTSDNGCRDTVIREVVVADQPVAIATAINNCVSDPILISAQSSVAVNGQINLYQWDYGNGYFNGSSSTIATYASPGTYPISLIVTNSAGCQDTTTVLVTAYENPVPAFSADTVCQGLSTMFLNASSLASGGAISYLWNFGDGTTSNLPQPNHIYSNAGLFPVSLVATSVNGCSDSVSQNVLVYGNPLPQIATVPEGCAPYQVTFSDASIPSSAPIVSWNWGFGFAQTGTGTNPTATFPNSGIFPVYLEVTDANGCKADSFFQAWVTVNSVPVAQFQTDTVCAGSVVILTDSSTSPGGAITGWSWQEDAGGVWQPGGPIFTTTYPLAGSYLVSLIVSDINGCIDTTSETILVEPNPIASFAADTVCEGTATQFINGSSITPQTLLSYEWDFGDGSAISQLSNPIHTYPVSGSYTTVLYAESGLGCRDSTVLTVLVNGNPTPIASPVPDGCIPYEVSFLDASVDAGAPIVSWLWDFGNGLTNTIQNPITVYDATGVFAVSLTVTDANGCQGDSLFQSLVTVHPTPEAGFYFDPASPSVFLSSIYFYNTSTNADSYVWDFGDGVFSVEENPYHVYDSTGIYLIELAVQNIFGCVDTLRQTMEVRDDYAFWTPNAFSPNGDGINEVFLPRGFNISNYSMSIYNRWGQRVFTTEKLEEGWDGKVDGIESKQDVYVFTIRFKDLFNKERSITGRVSLVR